MSNFDYFKQYQSEMQRIRNKIAEEENPYHKAHIAEFSEMIDDRIQAILPQVLQEQRENVRVEVETYMNGHRVSSSTDIVKGVKDMVLNALRRNREGEVIASKMPGETFICASPAFFLLLAKPFFGDYNIYEANRRR